MKYTDSSINIINLASCWIENKNIITSYANFVFHLFIINVTKRRGKVRTSYY